MSKQKTSYKNNPLKIIGKKTGRIDANKKITGRAIYTDDIYLPGTLYAKLKRSPIPHGIIEEIKIEKALALKGVKAIITGKDLPEKYGILPVTQDETALAIQKVRYVGEPVAAVCAETEEIAQDALELIEVKYKPLEPILSIEDAFYKGTRVHESDRFEGNAHRVIALEFGNVEKSFKKCDYIREDIFFYSGSAHLPMEPHSTLAYFDGNKLTLYVSHQAPYYLHRILSKVLSIPQKNIKIIVPYVGGGFGGKLDTFPDTVCAAKLSMITKRPVKITLQREEVFYNHRGRHPALLWIKTGLKKGEIVAMHFKSFLDGGAYGSFGVACAYYQGALQPATYKIPNYKIEVVRFYTNKPPCGPKRGHGTPQPRFALECHIDKIAEDLKSNPVEIRMKNLVEPNSLTVNYLKITSCGLKDCIEKVTKGSKFLERYGKLPYGEGIGLAVSTYLSGAALPIYWNEMPHSEVILKADRSGNISVFSGHTEIGQGADTTLSYIVAECLGIEPEDITLVLRDTDSVPTDLGSYSSRVTYMMGNAAYEAATKLKEVLKKISSEILDEPEENLIFEMRKIKSKINPQKELSFEEAIRKAEEKFGALSFSGSYKPPSIIGKYKGAGVGPSPAYSYTACVVEVKIDLDTGFIKPLKVWIAHDIGKCINRANVEGQIEGSIYMALGEALMEKTFYTRGGLLGNPNLLDYKTLTIKEIPEIQIYLIESEDKGGPYGAKEVGQGPLLPVIPALVNAVYDAIGIRFDEIPITPDKVLESVERKIGRYGPREIIEFPFPKPIKVKVPQNVKT